MLSEHREAFLEAVCDKMSQIMTAIKDQKNFVKRYKFESIIETFLKKKRSNSSRFIEYCELNTNDNSRNSAESDDDIQEFIKLSMKKR